MASSSVSQESIDIEDYDLYARRSRIRTMRGRTTPGQHKTEYHESMESGDHKDAQEDELGSLDTNGLTGLTGDHESPTRLASRLKDKRVIRPNHLHKPKTAKDKRKLREKRRSTGVVHLQQPSTEVLSTFGSTGDSLDEDETRKNTQYNEFIDADNPQTPEEERKAFPSRNVRNKSPSDLEADLEDNQDYDSTVSQSETNLSSLGQSSSAQSLPNNNNSKPQPPQAPPSHQASSATCVGTKANGTTITTSSQIHHHHERIPRQPLVFTKEKTPPPLQRNLPERIGSHLSSTPSASVPVPARPSQNSQVRWKDSSSGDLDLRRRHKVHWQTSEGSTSPSNNSNSNTAGSVEELDVSTRLRELEQVLARERQERIREKEERQKLQEVLYEREKTIEHLQKEVSLLHQDLENLDVDRVKLKKENRTLLQALNDRSAYASK